MNTPVTTEEKMAVATAYVKKMRKLMAIRLALFVPLSYIFFNMRNLDTGKALCAFMVLAAILCGLAINSQANLYCPFCGERFGYWISKLEILPDECPECGERIKY